MKMVDKHIAQVKFKMNKYLNSRGGNFNEYKL